MAARHRSESFTRLWKNLGKSAGKTVRITQYYAQKSSVDATKVLVAQGFLLDHPGHGSREHRPVRSGTGCPSGGGRTARDRGGSVQSSPSGGLSGRCGRRSTATAASRRALLGPVPIARRRRLPSGIAVTAPDQGDASSRARLAVSDRRDAGGARWTVPVTGPAPEVRRCPARTPQAVGRAHPLVEPGSRQRLLEGRRTAREGVPAPFAFCARRCSRSER
jgi:hypothetical protein